MGRIIEQLTPELIQFIERQKVYFVATAPPSGAINLSPKGVDTLRVIDPRRVVWLNLTGSGNETAGHLRVDPRITVMFCAFDGDPLILRLYGRAEAIHPNDPRWEGLLRRFPELPGARQVIDVTIDRVHTSCGFGVPLMDYRGEREQLVRWAEKKGPDGIERYWREKNRLTIDGEPTGIVEGEGR